MFLNLLQHRITIIIKKGIKILEIKEKFFYDFLSKKSHFSNILNILGVKNRGKWVSFYQI